MRPGLAAFAVALIVAPGAAAHITLTPAFVEVGIPTEIRMTVPGERPSTPTIGVEATMPSGVSIVVASSPDGWAATVEGATVKWAGGRIEGRAEVVFPVRIDPDVSPGTYGVAVRQRYADGAVVPWNSDLLVLPSTGEVARSGRTWPALGGAALGALVLIGASLLVLRRLRR